MRTQFCKISAFVITILFASIFLNGCSDTVDPPEEEEKVTITLNPIDTETDAVLDEATHQVGDDIIAVGRDDITRTEGTELSVRTEADGYEPKATDITFDRDDTVDIRLTPEEEPDEDPEFVTVTYSAVNDVGEPVTEAELSIADTLVSSGESGSFELPFNDSETVTVCGSAAWHDDGCSELLPDADQEIDLILPRELISISVTPEIVDYNDYYAVNTDFGIDAFVADNTMYYLSVGDSTRSGAGKANSPQTEIAEGVTTTIQYPAGPEPIAIHLRAEYFPEEGHAYSDNFILNVAEGETEVVGDADSDIQLDLAHIPACSDGVDNDFSGVMDENAPGCIDYETSTSHEVGAPGWVYDPDDDVELLQVASFSGQFGGNSINSVSSAAGNRESWVGGSRNLPESLKFAIGQIDYYLSSKIQTDKDHQAFAVKFVYRENQNAPSDTTGITEIVPDDPNVDGWRTSLINGVDASFFSLGVEDIRMRAFHASKINGDPPGDGDDEVIFAVPDTSGYTAFTWVFEPEIAAAAAEKLQSIFGKESDVDIQIHDVKTRDPRDAIRRLRKQQE